MLDTPLLDGRSTGSSFAAAWSSSTRPIEVAVERVVEQRGLTEDDARARISKQISREERVALADFVVDNGGDLPQLEAQVDALWAWIDTLAVAPSLRRPDGRARTSCSVSDWTPMPWSTHRSASCPTSVRRATSPRRSPG